MKILELTELVRKDMPIDYRREYTGTAVLETPDRQSIRRRFSCTLEHAPTGGVSVRVSLLEAVDYPLVPLIRLLKQQIGELDRSGRLP